MRYPHPSVGQRSSSWIDAYSVGRACSNRSDVSAVIATFQLRFDGALLASNDYNEVRPPISISPQITDRSWPESAFDETKFHFPAVAAATD